LGDDVAPSGSVPEILMDLSEAFGGLLLQDFGVWIPLRLGLILVLVGFVLFDPTALVLYLFLLCSCVLLWRLTSLINEARADEF
jgi:hypothetical protein